MIGQVDDHDRYSPTRFTSIGEEVMQANRLRLALAAMCCTMATGATADEPLKKEAAFSTVAADGFKDDAVVINFDSAPDGRRLTAGNNLTGVYASKGCIFDAAIKGSKIVVADYRVYEDKCAANLEPIFEGGINVRFTVPGTDQPGCVHSIGCYVAWVEVGGVALTAYDADGKLIGEVRNLKRARDFIGMQSKIPIARVGICGVPMVDNDFAIDNLMFDSPKRLSKMPRQ